MKERKNNRWPGLRIRIAGLLGAIALYSLAGCGGVPETEVVQREMIAAGKASYRAYCAGCHGATARGDGPAGELMQVSPADLTQITARYGRFPEDLIFDRIDGYTDPADTTVQMMPSWGEIWRGVNTEWETPQDVRERINQIVAYLRSIQQTSM